jgi:hypothetical protein
MVVFAGFARVAYDDPAALPVSSAVREEYITSHAAGYGVREAVRDFPNTIGAPGAIVIASMFPDSCRRANFYDELGYGMICADAPALREIRAALGRAGEVYVVAEAPPIGLAFDQVGLNATRIAAYPRPGETPESSSVTVWRALAE